MSRTRRCRRAFSFARAFAKRSSSAVAAVFTSARLGAAGAGLSFLADLVFFFAFLRKVLDFARLKCPLRAH